MKKWKEPEKKCTKDSLLIIKNLNFLKLAFIQKTKSKTTKKNRCLEVHKKMIYLSHLITLHYKMLFKIF
jgi:hypothetical protein